MSAEEKVAVGRCRIIAGQTIADIDLTCEDNLIAGWNAVWLMYQAAMVPLVSLFSYLSSPSAYIADSSPGKNAEGMEAATYGTTGGDEDADRWREQIETAIRFFEKMHRYSVAAKKSKDVVVRLYAASKHINQSHEQQLQRQPSTFLQQRQNLAPGHGGHAKDPSSDQFISRFAANPQPNSQPLDHNSAFGQSIWGLSPNGNAAMESFWDDMMWETFPEVPEAPSWGHGLDQFNWVPPSEQQNDPNANNEDWPGWSFDRPQG